MSSTRVDGSQGTLFTGIETAVRRNGRPIDRRRVQLELEGLERSAELGCGCIPLVPAHETSWGRASVATGDVNGDQQSVQVDPALLYGYISLRGRSPIHRSDIVGAYTSTGVLETRERNDAITAKLELFVEEVEELLGEGEKKRNLIIEGLEGHPQAQLQSIIAAYEHLCSASIALNGFSESSMREYYTSIWGTLTNLRTTDNFIDQSKLVAIVNEIRPDQNDAIKNKLASRSNRVALSLWIAREKAKQEAMG